MREGDGYCGWREAAPFDAIIVKEAVDHLPGTLFQHDTARIGYPGSAAGPNPFLMSSEDQFPTLLDTLLAQLRAGGRFVLPLGPLHGRQELTVVYKGADGSLREKHILPVRFTPFHGGERT